MAEEGSGLDELRSLSIVFFRESSVHSIGRARGMGSGEQWIYSRLLILVGSSSSPLGTPYCYCLSKLSLPIQPFWQPTNVGFELHLYWLQNEEINSHWHLSLFPYRDLRPYKISPYVAFCTSLPPELELEAELLTYSSFFPVSNRKRIGRGLGNGTRIGHSVQGGEPIVPVHHSKLLVFGVTFHSWKQIQIRLESLDRGISIGSPGWH